MEYGTMTKIGTGQSTDDGIIFDGSEYVPQPIGVDFVGFRAHRNSSHLTLPNNTTVDFAAATEDFDVGGYYDTSTYRYTPLVAGKYYFYLTGQLNNDGTLANTRMNASITHSVDGTVQTTSAIPPLQTNFGFSASTSMVFDMNGSTDYVTFSFYQSSASALTEQLFGFQSRSWCLGFLIR